jgi:putative aldouronate transport system permease protein
LPSDLRESAFIDGANDIYILFRIVLPLSKPLLATFALFSIVGHWNSWFNAMIYLTDANKHPLQMLLRMLVVERIPFLHARTATQLQYTRETMHPRNIEMAAVVVAMVPILMIYPFMQRYFAKGIMIGAIKG